MKLADFIESRLEGILVVFEAFARTRLPAAQGLSSEDLRDEAAALLLSIAADMRTTQSAENRADKSRGMRPQNAPDITSQSQEHARARLHVGFSLDQLVSEYRALRASVVQLWSDGLPDARHEALDDIVRFNEAIDQAQIEAIAYYSKELEESRHLLLGILGHDLRNPLAAIRNSAHYLLRTNSLDGTQTKAVTRILNSSARMDQIVSDLLDFARTRLGAGLPIAPIAADLCDICRQVVEELEASYPDREICLECDPELKGSWDAARIAQLLSNLIANAMQHGDPAMPVTVTTHAERDGVVLEIHNQGPHIAPEAQEAIFRPMTRAVAAKAERQDLSSGLGLGLYISRQIVLAHGGSIELTSSERDGTTFIVRLPRHARPQEPGDAAQAE
jgi:signal transduction histidine kinase